ncbi:MAG TPA: DUF3829 domain-containing protein [Polyangiaceae bacterium]
MSIRYGFAACTLAFLACACSKADHTQNTGPGASGNAQRRPPPAAEIAAQARDGQIAEKLNVYIKCLNLISSQVSRCQEYYLAYADEKTGPNPKQAPSFNLNVSGDGICLEGLAKAKQLPPPLPDMEPSVTAYEQSLREVLPLIKDAKEYYGQGNYKDDKFAKGKAMHEPLVAAFAKFAAANKALDAKVTKLDDELSERRLALLEKDPDQKLHYLVSRSEKEAKAIIAAASVKAVGELDLGKYAPLVDTYEKTLAEIDTYVPAHKQEADRVNSFTLFEPSAKSFLKAAKELLRAKRDAKEFTNDGNPKQVLDEYNRFISSCNMLYFR